MPQVVLGCSLLQLMKRFPCIGNIPTSYKSIFSGGVLMTKDLLKELSASAGLQLVEIKFRFRLCTDLAYLEGKI